MTLIKTTSSVFEQGKSFGGRLLTDETRVFDQNAWDHVSMPPEHIDHAAHLIDAQRALLIDSDRRAHYERKASDYWDDFYTQHENRFFKDRHWFPVEFPELFHRPHPSLLPATQSFRVLEAGCGVGNGLFPLLRHHLASIDNSHLFGCDFSPTAIDLIQRHPLYNPDRCTVFVHDITQPIIHSAIPPNSLDCILLIFVLSALPPAHHARTLTHLASLLRPGGLILFRDYGRYDLTQLRFKPGRMLSTNHHYIRGDGTQVSYFDLDELTQMVERQVGLQVEQSAVDNRLLVNRAKKVKMYRVWVQCKWRKPIHPTPSTTTTTTTTTTAATAETAGLE